MRPPWWPAVSGGLVRDPPGDAVGGGDHWDQAQPFGGRDVGQGLAVGQETGQVGASGGSTRHDRFGYGADLRHHRTAPIRSRSTAASARDSGLFGSNSLLSGLPFTSRPRMTPASM